MCNLNLYIYIYILESSLRYNVYESLPSSAQQTDYIIRIVSIYGIFANMNIEWENVHTKCTNFV